MPALMFRILDLREPAPRMRLDGLTVIFALTSHDPGGMYTGICDWVWAANIAIKAAVSS